MKLATQQGKHQAKQQASKLASQKTGSHKTSSHKSGQRANATALAATVEAVPLFSAAHFRAILLKEREEILNRASFAVSSGEMVVDKVGDEGDLALAEVSVAERARLMERRAHLLQKIEYALSRLDEGTYFECEGCEEPLAQSRLLARPVASLCIACKEEQESRENHFA